jgi:hypothetical protein
MCALTMPVHPDNVFWSTARRTKRLKNAFARGGVDIGNGRSGVFRFSHDLSQQISKQPSRSDGSKTRQVARTKLARTNHGATKSQLKPKSAFINIWINFAIT